MKTIVLTLQIQCHFDGEVDFDEDLLIEEIIGDIGSVKCETDDGYIALDEIIVVLHKEVEFK